MRTTFLLLSLLFATSSYATNCTMLFGDSLTAGLERNADGSAYCSATDEQLSSSQVTDCKVHDGLNRGGYAPKLAQLTGHPVYNTSYTNYTSGQMISKVASVLPLHQCSHVYVLLGTNDAIQGVATSTTISNLQQIADMSPDVAFILLPPLTGSNKSFAQPQVDAINEAIKNNFYYVDSSAITGAWTNEYSSGDNLHLSPAGNNFMASLLYSYQNPVETPEQRRANLQAMIYLLLQSDD